MQPTPYSHINELLDSLLTQMQAILGKKLIGLYLGGSLVIGDFDLDISDIDLVAALSSDLDDTEFEASQKMHADFALKHKEWDNRIEVCYISLAALNTVKSRTSQIANISPGEPFHRRESSREWLTSWYLVREKSIALFGPSPKTIIEPISKDEFIQSIQAHAKGWRNWIYTMYSRKAQAYAILTLCRALYTHKYGEQVSKKQAALWAEEELPQWSSLISSALLWRAAPSDEESNPETTFQEILQFVDFMTELIIEQR